MVAPGSAPTTADLPPTAPVITGRGWHAPEDRLSNEDIARCLDERLLREFVEKNKWCQEQLEPGVDLTRPVLEQAFVRYVKERIGIETRHVIDREAILSGTPSKKQQFASDLGTKACARAMEDAGVGPEDIELVICGTSSPDRLYPTTGIQIQENLGLPNAHAYDLLAACSAFAFGLHHARALVASGIHRRVLVVSAEYFTAAVNYADPNNSFFWGDAGAAVVVERADHTKKGGLHVVDSHCISMPSDAIRTGLGGTRPYLAGATRFSDRKDGDIELGAPDDPYFYQDGRKVFRDVVPRVVAETGAFIRRNDLSVDDIRRFWFHQPSRLFLGAVTKRLLKDKDDTDRVAVSLNEYGNTSSCGAPLCLAQDEMLNPGEYGVVSVFGAGYTIGLGLLRAVTAA